MAKKGQGALEYLMTYGWALLVIVIVVAALYAMGILNPATYTQKRCTGFNYFTWKDHKLTTTAFTVELQNRDRDVSITGVNFGGTALNQTATSVSATNTATLSPTGDPTTKNAGDTFSETVIITYDIVGGITGNSDRGTCTGKVE